MPILTPCAEAGAANKRPPIATAANQIDFIRASPEVSVVSMLFYNPAAAHLFRARLTRDRTAGVPAAPAITPV
jgi:hypothetical protein